MSDVPEALKSKAGVDIMLQLVSLLEKYDVPIVDIEVTVNVRARKPDPRYIGEFLGMVKVYERSV